MGRTAPKPGCSRRITTGDTRGRVALRLSTEILSGARAHARLPALGTPEPSSPDESGSEDGSSDGTEYSSIGEESSADGSTGGAADSADTDPPDMRGACFAFWGRLCVLSCLVHVRCYVRNGVWLTVGIKAGRRC
jgi:hypothetical protein